MAVAAAVVSGAADTGLAVLSAARALELDFILVAKERYDLAIPGSSLIRPCSRRCLRSSGRAGRSGSRSFPGRV